MVEEAPMELIVSALVFAFKKIADKAADGTIETGLELLKSKLLDSGDGQVKESLESLQKDPSQRNQKILNMDLEASEIENPEELIEIAKQLLGESTEGQTVINQVLGAGAKAAAVSGNQNTVNIQ